MSLILKSQLTLGERWVTPQIDCQSTAGLTFRDKQPFTLTPTGNLESSIDLNVFGLWEESREPTQAQREHANLRHLKMK